MFKRFAEPNINNRPMSCWHCSDPRLTEGSWALPTEGLSSAFTAVDIPVSQKDVEIFDLCILYIIIHMYTYSMYIIYIYGVYVYLPVAKTDIESGRQLRVFTCDESPRCAPCRKCAVSSQCPAYQEITSAIATGWREKGMFHSGSHTSGEMIYVFIYMYIWYVHMYIHVYIYVCMYICMCSICRIGIHVYM